MCLPFNCLAFGRSRSTPWRLNNLNIDAVKLRLKPVFQFKIIGELERSDSLAGLWLSPTLSTPSPLVIKLTTQFRFKHIKFIRKQNPYREQSWRAVRFLMWWEIVSRSLFQILSPKVKSFGVLRAKYSVSDFVEPIPPPPTHTHTHSFRLVQVTKPCVKSKLGYVQTSVVTCLCTSSEDYQNKVFVRSERPQYNHRSSAVVAV